MAAEIRRQMSEMVFYDPTVGEKAIADLGRVAEVGKRNLAIITDASAAEKERRSEIQSFRNHPLSGAVDVLLELACEPANPATLRVTALETLGWYTMSYKRGEIITGLNRIADTADDKAVAYEATKSINRLTDR